MQTASALHSPVYAPAPAFNSYGSAPPPAPASPFLVVPQRDDTALFQDARAGFSHLLPGRPVLGNVRLDEMPTDVALNLRDAPISVQYRFEPPQFPASSAAEVAKGTAERIAGFRAQARIAVDFANPSWLGTWSCEAAAVASYDVVRSNNREDLFVLVKEGMVMIVRWTYPRGFVDDPAYATFASVAEATMIWDRTRWEQHGRVWPTSEFVGPGLYGQPRPKYNEIAKTLAQAPIAPQERAHLFNVLSAVVSGAGAPWVALSPEIKASHQRSIGGATSDPTLRAFVAQAFSDVRTAHDLRGLAVFIGRALDQRRHSSRPPSMPPTR